jgi:alcohol dehydrogenase
VSRLVAIPRPVALVGAGSTQRLCALIAQGGARRVMIVTDAVLVRHGVIAGAVAELQGRGIDVAIHDRITPDPTYTVLEAAHDAVRVHRSEVILAIGGGSVIDAAKIVAAMAGSGKRPERLLGMLRVGPHMLPLYAVPTTAGTGSEVTVAAVMTDPVRHEKAAAIDPKLVPLATALDPLLMTGLPPAITAATGMDALTHAVEAYLNLWPHPETAGQCLAAVRLIFTNLPRACEQGNDLVAREAMAMAAFYAGLAFTKAYVGYVHAFSHKIGALYGVPHGLSNAIVLPYVLDYLKDAPRAATGLAELAVAIGAGQAAEPRPALAQRFVDRVRELNAHIGIPARLDALRSEDIRGIARAAMIEAHRDYPVPKRMTLVEAEALLRTMLRS